jgi:hypothetical protein
MKIVYGFLLILCANLSAAENENQLSSTIPFNGSKWLLLQSTVEVDSTDLKKTSNHQNPARSKKSVGKAFLYSLVLPGAGQYYLEKNNSALLFVGLELLIIGGLLGNQFYTEHLIDEYQAYSVAHAGVHSSNKNKEYWTNIGKYDDIYSFNDKRERERRFSETYVVNSKNFWQWDSRGNRYTYDAMRINANEVASQDIYFWGALLLNHLGSAIHAMAKARQYNKSIDSAKSINISFKSFRYPSSKRYFGVHFQASF